MILFKQYIFITIGLLCVWSCDTIYKALKKDKETKEVKGE